MFSREKKINLSKSKGQVDGHINARVTHLCYTNTKIDHLPIYDDTTNFCMSQELSQECLLQ